MSAQQTPPAFHEAYAGLVAGLPPSQLREAHKRLMRCKQPLTAEEIVGEHPRIQACLEKISAAYTRKKGRSAVASKSRRDDARDKLGASEVAVADAPKEEEEASVLPVSDLTVAMADVSLVQRGLPPEPAELASSTAVVAAADEPPSKPALGERPVSSRRATRTTNKALLASRALAPQAPPALPVENSQVDRAQVEKQGRRFFVNQT